MRFSVGIPAYNQGDFLEETILSLLNQTRPADEIVISDHDSTDQTPDIIAKYSGHVRGIKPPHGSNVGAQWDFTLSSLTGDWVTLLSSDDVARPNFVDVLVRGAERRSDAVLVRAGWENIGRDGAILSKEYLLSVKAVTLPPQTLFEQKHGPKASFAAFAVKNEALRSSGGYPRNMESYGDWPMFMQLAPLGSFIYEHEIISGYRIGHDGNKFRKRIGMWLRDEMRMSYEVIPLAATRAGMTTPEQRAWIEEASSANFLRYLAAASEEFAPAERAEIVPLFEAWAVRTGSLPLLQSFACGERITEPFSLAHKAKRILRPIAQNLSAFLHQR